MALAALTTSLTVLSALASLSAAASKVSETRAEAAAETASAQQADIEAEIVPARAAREAVVSVRQGKEEAEIQRKSGGRFASTQQARFGKAGVTLEGSPMLVLSETVEEAETAALRSSRGSREETTRILESGEDVSRARTFEAGQRRFRAAQTKKAGIAAAGTSLLTGGLEIANIFK